MDTLPIAVLLCYILCLVIGLTVAAVTIVYSSKHPSSKGTRKLKIEGGQRKKSAREEKTESQPVLKRSSGRGMRKRAVDSGEKPLKPEPAADEVLPEIQETGKARPSKGVRPWSKRGKREGITFPTRNKAVEQIEPIEVRKQVQPKNIAPVESSEPSVAAKDASANTAAPPVAPQRQTARPEAPKQVQPKSTAPIKSSEPTVTAKDASANITAPPVAPQRPPATTEAPKQSLPKNTAPVKSSEPKVTTTTYTVNITTPPVAPQQPPARPEQKGREKPPQEQTAVNTSGSEASMGSGPGPEGKQASSDLPATTADSDESDEEKSQTQKSGMGDLADLFATSASEFTEKNKLADQVNDVDVNEILQAGLGLLRKVKKSDD